MPKTQRGNSATNRKASRRNIEKGYQKCYNFNIEFATECKLQRPMRPRGCSNVKHTLTNGGECKSGAQ